MSPWDQETQEEKKKQTIDGIWGSKGIKIYQGGYLPYQFGPKSDHIILSIKIPHLVAFGEKNHPSDQQQR